MKIHDLDNGIYFDGKKGLRLFLRREGDAAVYHKIEVSSTGPQVVAKPLLCPVSDFARWARQRLDPAQLRETALSIAARTVSLTPEQARALHGLTQGVEVRGKVRTSLLEKNLVCCKGASAVLPRLTELGARVLNRLSLPGEKKA